MQQDRKFNQRIQIIKSFNKNWQSCNGTQSIQKTLTMQTNKPLAFNKIMKNKNQGTPVKINKDHRIFTDKKMSFSQPRTAKHYKYFDQNGNLNSKQNDNGLVDIVGRRESFQNNPLNYRNISQFNTQCFKQINYNVNRDQEMKKNYLQSYYKSQKVHINRNDRSESFNLSENKREKVGEICKIQQFRQIKTKTKNKNSQQPAFKKYYSNIDQIPNVKNHCKTQIQQENQYQIPYFNQHKYSSVFAPQPKKPLNAVQWNFNSPAKNIEDLTQDIDELFAKIEKLKKQCEIDDETFKNRNSINKSPLASRNQHIKIERVTKIQKLNLSSKGKIKPNQQNIIIRNQTVNKCQETQNTRIRDFELGKKIGSGKFGDVFMCIHKKTKALYALKKILKSTIKQYQMEIQFAKQLKIHYKLEHPNIVKLITHFDDEYHVFLLMQYAEGGSLIDKIKMNEQKASLMISQLINGLDYAHSKDIIHRDIKPENLVIFFDNTIKICDFGWATCLTNNFMKKSSTFCGTPDYVSPEMKDVGQYSFNVDLWSLGVFAYELVAGFPPFKKEVLQWVKKGVHNPQKWDWSSIAYPQQFSENLKLFIKSLLKQNPDDRISLQQCKTMPFILDRNKAVIKVILNQFELSQY